MSDQKALFRNKDAFDKQSNDCMHGNGAKGTDKLILLLLLHVQHTAVDEQRARKQCFEKKLRKMSG